MRLTPLGYKVIITVPLLLAAGLIWITVNLPVYNGLSFLLTLAVTGLLGCVVMAFSGYRAEYAHKPRHGSLGWREAEPEPEPRHTSAHRWT